MRPSASSTQVKVSENYGRLLPLYFEANRGQTDPEVKFLARGLHQTLFLTPTEAVLVVTKLESSARDPAAQHQSMPRGPATGTVLRMTVAGANAKARVTGSQELPGKANYFIANDPAMWRTNVPTFARVRYEDIYPGVDLIYYGNQRKLEYDFVVHPGADPTRIVLRFQGADRIEVDGQGDLVLHTAIGAIRQRKPVIYQEVDSVKKEIAGGYVLTGEHQVGFKVAAYDAGRPLVIDPVLLYSTYLGGSGFDVGQAIAVDAAGNVYVTGGTDSSDFPTTAGAFQRTLDLSGSSAFVTKINPTGTAVVYSTYLGGGGQGLGIAVDATGNAYVAGVGVSPTTPGAFQTVSGRIFVTKLNPTGSALIYSARLGGSGTFELPRAIAVDAAGNAHVTGLTSSTDFPTTIGAFQTTYGGGLADAFVTKLNPSGTALVYSTYLGGSDFDSAPRIAVDDVGSAYVTGLTASSNFPTTLGAFQTTLGSAADAFVTKLNPTGTALVYSTYLGGNGDDGGAGIAVDTAGNAYVAGATASSNFPTTIGAFQTTYAGGIFDAFVTKLDPTGTTLVYSTYLGGGDIDEAFGIAVDAAGNAYVTGVTYSTDFPTTIGAFQTTFGGVIDAFVTKISPTGIALAYSTYLGGSDFEEPFGIVVDASPNPNAYITGHTASSDFPTTSGAFQRTYGGGSSDAFVAKITDSALRADLSIEKSGSPDPVVVGRDLSYSVIVTNAGPDMATGVVADDQLPTSVGVISVSSGCSYDSSTHHVTCTISALAPNSSATFTIVVRPTLGGTISNTVSVTAGVFDPNTGNNTATLTTTVNGPPNTPPACGSLPPSAKKPPVCP